MNKILAAAMLALALTAPAQALETEAGLGKSDLLYREYLTDGSEYNREQGWLNALYLAVAGDLYRDLDWTASFERDWAAVDYIGQSQSGTPSDSRTDENFRTLLLGLRWRPDNSPWSLQVRYGKTDWQRGIRANDITGELNEDYRWRLLQTAVAWHGDVSGHGVTAEAGYSRKMNGTIEVDLRPYGGRVGHADLATGHSVYLDMRISLLQTRVGEWLLSGRYSQERAAQSQTGNAGVVQFVEPESKSRSVRYLLLWKASF